MYAISVKSPLQDYLTTPSLQWMERRPRGDRQMVVRWIDIGATLSEVARQGQAQHQDTIFTGLMDGVKHVLVGYLNVEDVC